MLEKLGLGKPSQIAVIVEDIEKYKANFAALFGVPEPGFSTGGGLHHFGFQVPDMDEAIAKCEAAGLKLTQKGYYGSGNGMYAYFDATESLKCYIELLCSF